MTVEEIMARVNKDLKEEAFVTGIPKFNYEKIPFTSPQMNYVTYNGIPLGRLIEFYGEEGGGKTTTALDLIANFQQIYPDRYVAYIDAENTLDYEWAEKIGVDISRIKLYQPKTESAEYIFQVIKDLTDSGQVGIWVLDSVPCLTSEADLKKDLTDDARVAGISGILTRFCREVVGPCAKNKCLGIFINQIRDKINSTIPGQTNTPGGRALRHFCTTRIEFRKGTYLDEKGGNISKSSGTPNGQRIMVNMSKTKFCRPKHHIGQYTVDYDLGIDYLTDLIDMAVQFEIIEKERAWFTVLDVDTGEVLKDKIQGQNKLKEILDTDDDLKIKVEEMVNTQMLKESMPADSTTSAAGSPRKNHSPPGSRNPAT